MNSVFRQHLVNPEDFQLKLQAYLTAFNPCLCLDSNSHLYNRQFFGTYDLIAAAGKKKEYRGTGAELLKTLVEDVASDKNWLFGYLSYDVKNLIEDLRSENFDGLQFPEIYFFQPQFVFIIRQGNLQIESDEASTECLEQIFLEIENSKTFDPPGMHNLDIQQRMPESAYYNKVKEIQQHIFRGDIYELNFCQEFFAESVDIDPYTVYQLLKAHAPSPFSSYLSFDHYHMVGASPERFLKKTGTFIIGQPMKGTNRRDKDMEIDRMLRRQLMEDPKERAENIMIVDLMRNDLSKTALKGTVKVVELCGVYPFTHWHQMISTVSSRVPDLCNPLDILLSAFPMGSMTGAPKVRALQLIEEYEMTKRGLFSGALGYFSPEGDFDFSVVIRSILYNSLNKYLSFQTGGAITALSVPGKEYQECLLKARGIMSVLHAD